MLFPRCDNMNLSSFKERFSLNEEQRQFYKMTAALTLPIALQNLMDTAVSGADALSVTVGGGSGTGAASGGAIASLSRRISGAG